MVGVGRVTTLHTPDTVYSQSASLASLGAAASRLGSRPQRRRLVAACPPPAARCCAWSLLWVCRCRCWRVPGSAVRTPLSTQHEVTAIAAQPSTATLSPHRTTSSLCLRAAAGRAGRAGAGRCGPVGDRSADHSSALVPAPHHTIQTPLYTTLYSMHHHYKVYTTHHPTPDLTWAASTTIMSHFGQNGPASVF